MKIYCWIVMIVWLLAYWPIETNKKTKGVSIRADFFLLLPIFGRVLGWW